MSKRNYTHIQVLLPEIKAVQAEGKTQREITEYYGFKDKQVVKELLKRAQAGSRDSSTAARQAEEKRCSQGYCYRAGI